VGAKNKHLLLDASVIIDMWVGAEAGKPPTWLKAQEAAGRKREEFLVG
jgi:hypothetical protein